MSLCQLKFATDKFKIAGEIRAYTEEGIKYKNYLVMTAGQKCAELEDQIVQLTAQRDQLHDRELADEEALAQMKCLKEIQMQEKEEARVELEAEKTCHAGVDFD